MRELLTVALIIIIAIIIKILQVNGIM